MFRQFSADCWTCILDVCSFIYVRLYWCHAHADWTHVFKDLFNLVLLAMCAYVRACVRAPRLAHQKSCQCTEKVFANCFERQNPGWYSYSHRLTFWSCVSKASVVWKFPKKIKIFKWIHKPRRATSAHICLLLYHTPRRVCATLCLRRTHLLIVRVHRSEARWQYARAHNEHERSCFCDKAVTTRTLADAGTKQSNASTLADFSAVAS